MLIKTKIAPNEKELIEGCEKGIEKYCKLLFNTYYGIMLGICRRYTPDAEESKDILQEGFIKIFRYLKQYKQEGSFEGWMKRIMVNTAIDHYKKSIREHTVNYLNDEEIDRPEILDQDDNDLFPVNPQFLLSLVQQLPVVYRMVFNLSIIEGYSHKKIGEMLGINESTSRSNLSKAKNKVRMMLKDFNHEKRSSYAV